MLESLHVKNLALIDEQEVFFAKGMNILTGETGAGKSILIGSINLALGAKADKEYIRTGAEYALIELIFSLNEQQSHQVRELDIPLEDGNQLILQRKIMPGRSICRANGEAITATAVKALAGCLLDMYGQHEHQSLLQPSAGRKMLDDYAGEEISECKRQLKQMLGEYRKTCEEWNTQDMDEAARVREQQLLCFEIQEIEAAGLRPQEDELVEKKYRRMINSKKIKDVVHSVHAMTGYEKDGGAGQAIGYALRELKIINTVDEAVIPLIAHLTDIDDLLNDFNRSIAEYQEELEFDEEEYAQLEERLNILNHLKSKYGDSIGGILEKQQEKQNRLEKINDYEAYRQRLQQQIEKQKKEILCLCRQISEKRRAAAIPLTEKLKAAMIDLNFNDVNFAITVKEQEEDFSAEGYDEIEFLISTNPGEQLKPLRQIASGGELSRIMLAFKTVFADKDETDTLVFDEIDTGISGKTAWKVAQKLGRLAQNHQIICITHLAQIAAMADTHFLIEKQVRQERTSTDIRKLQEAESLEELARLLGSGVLTEAVLNNAREMKESAKEAKLSAH